MFLVAPQWHGSGSSRALRLVDGAHAIRGDLPSSATTTVEIPSSAGDDLDSGVARLSSLVTTRDRMAAELATATDPVITIGGDCGVELASIDHAWGPDVAVVWFDAHPDLHTPASSSSGFFGGMVLRTLLGDGPTPLNPATPLSPGHIVLVGAREIDDAEKDYIAAKGIPVVSAETQAIVEAVAATGADRVYLHIDLDVLDPGTIDGLGSPVPFGLSAAELLDAITSLRARFAVAGAGITAFAPSSPEQASDDLPTILRIIGALTRPR